MQVEHELPAKIGRCSKKIAGHNFDHIAKLWPANFYIYSSQEDFALESKLWPANFLEHRFRFFFFRNKGQIWPAVTLPCRLSTLLCHTYSEMSGHEDSPGGTQYIPYIFKNLSKSINFLEHMQMTRIHVKIHFDQVKIIFRNQFRNTKKN